MPEIAISIQSAGLGPVSWSQMQLAVQRGRGAGMVQRLFTVNNIGSSGVATGPILVGVAETNGSHYFPERHQGKTFPGTLAGKYLKVSVPAGYSAGTGNVTLTFEVHQLRSGAYVEIYKWVGPVRMSNVYLGGVSVEGTPRANNPDAQWVQERINDLMS